VSACATRLLLVDDERELVTYLSKRFSKKDLAVCGVTSGKAAVEEVNLAVFDVAILDLKMPEMDGLVTLRSLKRVQPLLQVIVLTGHGTIAAALESGREDAYMFIEKPYDFERLVLLVREAHEYRRRLQRQRFEEERSAILTAVPSPREGADLIEALRRAYEQEP
jgi:DNA-binding NtrC family response regulator